MPIKISLFDYHKLFKTLPGLYIILLPTLEVVAVTDDYLKATMVKREDLVGRKLFDVFPENPEDKKSHGSINVRGSIEKVFQTGEADILPVQKYDVQRPAEQGGEYEERYWRISTLPGFDRTGNVAYVTHYVENITEQIKLQQQQVEQGKLNAELQNREEKSRAELKQAEVELDDVRLRLKAALEAGEIGTWTWDIVNNRVVADENLAKFFSVSEEITNGGQIEEYTKAIHPHDCERVGEIINQALEKDDFYETEYRLINPDNSIRWVVARGRVLRNENGEPFQLPGVVIDITERKKAEEEIRESQQRLKFALDAGKLGSYQLILATGEMTCSERCLANFGLPTDADLPFDKLLSMIQPNDRERVKQAIEESIDNQTSYEIEYQITRADGKTAWIFARGSTIYDNQKKPLVTNGVTLDITERKRIEEKLRVSDERFQLVIQATNDAIWDWNLQTNEVWWNNAIQTMFGYTADQVEMTSTWWYEHIHPEDRDRIVSGIHDVIDNGGENWSDEYRYLCADGSYKYIFDRGFAIHYGGQPIRMLGAMQDVTARRETESALRKSQERLQLVLDSSKFGLWYCDLPFDVLSWSDLTKRHFWLSPEATVTIDDFYRIIHPEDRQKTRAAIDKSIEDRTQYDVEYRTVNAENNQIKYIRAIGRGFYDENHNPYRFDGITIDITDEKMIQSEREHLLWSEKEARTEAEKANRLKDEFLATLSHELRTPLSSILGWARLLKQGQLKDEQSRRALETIERNAKSQSQLIEDILDVSRIISGKLRLDVQPVDLANIIEMAIDAVRPAANARNIRLQRVIDTNVLISGDADRLQQVIWNLLSNAIKFTPKDGKVQIKLARIESHVEITVADNGLGIDGEILPFIFERFRQSDSSSTRKHGGLGLGLAIVRHLVELHGGTVHATSEGLNKGSTFTVIFPLIALRSKDIILTDELEVSNLQTKSNGESALNCPPEIKGLRILLVDDEPDTRELLVFVFKNCQANITGVSSVNEALEALKTNEFDVLVSDIGMPERDGYDLIKSVREFPASQGGRIPAVALTAYARTEDRVRALSAGFQIHIAKPVEPAELLTVVASLANWNNGKY